MLNIKEEIKNLLLNNGAKHILITSDKEKTRILYHTNTAEPKLYTDINENLFHTIKSDLESLLKLDLESNRKPQEQQISINNLLLNIHPVSVTNKLILAIRA